MRQYRRKSNKLLTPHFSRFEVIEGVLLPTKAKKMNWAYINEFDEEKFIPLLEDMEGVRRLINILYRYQKNHGREIGLEITSGWRCKEWELYRGRSGNSMHTVCAVDIRPSGCPFGLKTEIIYRLHNIFWSREDGYFGGFAIMHPNEEAERIGALHFDRRGEVARWTY